MSNTTRIQARSSHAMRLERLPVLIFDDPAQMARQVARKVANLIQDRAVTGRMAVLGLPTGSTPIGVYRELVRMHQEEGLDFSNVITFNLDEYYPMKPDALQSYHRFMEENLFKHVNVPRKNIHIPRGDIPREEVDTHCDEYEWQIKKAGGIDLMLLGIGRSGHIGFNEPGSRRDDRTRMVVLDEVTRRDAAGDFFEEKNVPREAITMGVGSILECREIILMATGEHKGYIIRKAVEEEPNSSVTASFLQEHLQCTFYVDRASASELTREKTPWIVGDVSWSAEMARKAVVWLAKKIKKPILHLETADFHHHHMHDLVNAHGTADELTYKIFMELRDRIKYQPELPKKKSCICFSPHPDDDVISMGGMLGKLAQNKNDVTVAYMTNGSVAVFDMDVERHLRFLEMSARLHGGAEGEARIKAFTRPIFDFITHKKPGQIDTAEIQQLKAYIRYTEAIAGIEVMGLHEKDARFLDMPFYKTGEVKKAPIGEDDVQIVLDLFNEHKPDHIYVAGDLSDPHGTHRMCYTAIKRALEKYNQQEGVKKPLVWLYRGAWQEWEIEKADIFLPMSKADLSQKIDAIYKHESQKDRALFPGSDAREFWERARDRNVGLAREMDALGLPEFYAAEAYVTCHEMP
ncbi:MAG: glucosamine-6-phosphate deaminase [Bacteroidetes Order II. Incertae sedis bacterium]|nr:glucosamine-6-phosphate deaminase [Bacteroidetes Order II. bacterium]